MPAQQGRLFLAMLFSGTILGTARGALGLVWHGRKVCALLDLVLGVGCAVSMAAVGLAFGENPFRVYAFAGVLTGLAIVKVLAGTIVRFFRKFFMISSKKVEN